MSSKARLAPSQFHLFCVKPVVAAIIAGTAVHILIAFFGEYAVGHSFFNYFQEAFRRSFVLSLFFLVAPYVPPLFMAMYVQNTIGMAKEYQFMEHAKSGMALGKKTSGGSIQTINVNPAFATIFREDHKTLLSGEFLPVRFWKNVDEREHFFRELEEKQSMDDISLEFWRGDGSHLACIMDAVLRNDGLYQITLLDVTERRRLRDEVQKVYSDNIRLISGIENILSTFRSTDFDIEKAFAELFGSVLLAGDCRPSHIFSTSVQEHGMLAGHVYYQNENGEIVKSSDHITIDPNSAVAITRGKGAVYWSNGPEEGETAEEYTRNFNPSVLDIVGNVRNYATYCTGKVAIIAFNYCSDVKPGDADVLMAMAVLVNALETISGQTVETEEAFIYAMEALARACESFDEDTAMHLRRLNAYSRAIAMELGMDKRFVENIAYAAQMHDVGKIKVPLEILLKPGRLSDDEFKVMKRHPKQGADIIGYNPRVVMEHNIAYTHHEKWDGSGYPRGLKGEEIPIEGRIVALADVYDALRSRRSYKEPFSHEKTLKILSDGDERLNPKEHFDPAVLDAFIRIENQMATIFRLLSDEPEQIA